MNVTATLTKRETEIAELIAWGLSKKQIAKQLFISTRTVENTARAIYEKTGVTKSNELAAWWFCTKYKISLELSPIKAKIQAFALLVSSRAKMVFSRFPFDMGIAIASILTFVIIKKMQQ